MIPPAALRILEARGVCVYVVPFREPRWTFDAKRTPPRLLISSAAVVDPEAVIFAIARAFTDLAALYTLRR